MKFDISKKTTIGATRTLHSLNQALLLVLTEKSFEEITVGELCEKALLPRATFYNYFDDKYDLLEYCQMAVRIELGGVCEEEDHRTRLKQINTFLDNCIDYLDQNHEIIQNILKNNQPNQYLLNQFRFFVLSRIKSIFENSPDSHCFKIPRDMAASLYSHAILIILDWKYLDKRECSKEQAREYLLQMVSGINLE